jgi:hypothetical protein
MGTDRLLPIRVSSVFHPWLFSLPRFEPGWEVDRAPVAAAFKRPSASSAAQAPSAETIVAPSGVCGVQRVPKAALVRLAQALQHQPADALRRLVDLDRLDAERALGVDAPSPACPAGATV